MNVSRIGLIGDIHGQFRTLDAVLRFLLGGPPLDAVLCTGDIPLKGVAISGAAAREANTCCLLLVRAGVLTVRGNHDRDFVENAADSTLKAVFASEFAARSDAIHYLESLPPTRNFQTPLGTMMLCHGLGKHDLEGVYPGGDDHPIAEAFHKRGIIDEGIRLLVAGHTHQRMVRSVAGVTIINPGTLLPDKEPPGFAVADIVTRTVTFYSVEPDTCVIAPMRRDTIR